MIFDIETDGFNATKIHCLSYTDGKEIKSLYKYPDIKEFILSQDVLIGHNIIRFDIPVLERLLNIKVTARLIDTLVLSWYLYPTLGAHGLEKWGERLGVVKPKIEDWENLSLEEYIHRCEEDVKINSKLWDRIQNDLAQLYNYDKENINRLIYYMSFKMDCAREQEEMKVKLDIAMCDNLLSELKTLQKEKYDILASAMPKVPVYVEKTKPKVMYKKDGSLSAHGEKWFQTLTELGLSKAHSKPVKILKGHEEPNPNSHDQVKDWLFSLGWEPCTYKASVSKVTGSVNQVPQVRDDNKELCPSVKRLLDIEPKIKELEDLGVISHRIGVLEGFLREQENGYLTAGIAGLTNTLRFRHKTLVNIPSRKKAYGEEIRALLICEENEYICGADMSSLEDRTKQHYMYPYDPEYVETMLQGDYDPHLDLALHAGALTKGQVQAHKEGKENYEKERNIYKTANYACIYGAGVKKLAATAGITEKEAKKLKDAYWNRNKAVKQVENDAQVRSILGLKWVYNPVSRFWIWLKDEKDIFSAINQSTGAYCFDKWVTEVRERCIRIRAQFHDEILFSFPEELYDKEEIKSILEECIDIVNDELSLNVKLGIDVQFGESYAEVH